MLELLVVTAIIGLLATLLLPVLAGVKQQAKRAVCLNSERQLATVWMLYAGDHQDWLVPNGGYPAGPPLVGTGPYAQPQRWVQGAFSYPPAVTNRQWLLNPKYAAFADYIQHLEVYVCPADRPTIQAYGSSHPRLHSYALNAYLGWVGQWDPRLSAREAVIFKQAQLNGIPPVKTFLFQDVQADSICFPFFGVYLDVESFCNFPSTAHKGRGNVTFADGHVESHRWRDAQTFLAFSDQHHRHADPSANNPDLAWLRERSVGLRPRSFRRRKLPQVGKTLDANGAGGSLKTPWQLPAALGLPRFRGQRWGAA